VIKHVAAIAALALDLPMIDRQMTRRDVDVATIVMIVAMIRALLLLLLLLLLDPAGMRGGRVHRRGRRRHLSSARSGRWVL
jgi:hypothetical protein